jgi:RNA polymerase sigma factor (sigma-70 family)
MSGIDGADAASEAEVGLREGRRAHPDVELSLPPFAAALERSRSRARDRGDPPGGPLRTADLYLATACDERVPGAWETLQSTLFPGLRGLLARRGVPIGEIDDLLSDLSGYLCEPAPGGERPTRLGTYDGSGRLFSWLAVLAFRRLGERRRERTRVAGEPADLALLPAAPRIPLSALVEEETVRRFRVSLDQAWGDLTPRERLVVLLKFRDGLSQKDIARLLGVGEPRASRLVQAGLARLREAVAFQLRSTVAEGADGTLWKTLRDAVAGRLARSEGPSH